MHKMIYNSKTGGLYMPYTLGDIMETEHAQLWDDIKSFTNECISLQERVIGCA